MNIAIIPARSGSKRIKNKNIKKFHGKPIIAWSILEALKAKVFDKVIVSTDSEKIAKIARNYGAVTPFLRSILGFEWSKSFSIPLWTIVYLSEPLRSNEIDLLALSTLDESDSGAGSDILISKHWL